MLLLHFVMCMNDILLNGKATIVGIYFPILMAYYLFPIVNYHHVYYRYFLAFPNGGFLKWGYLQIIHL